MGRNRIVLVGLAAVLMAVGVWLISGFWGYKGRLEVESGPKVKPALGTVPAAIVGDVVAGDRSSVEVEPEHPLVVLNRPPLAQPKVGFAVQVLDANGMPASGAMVISLAGWESGWASLLQGPVLMTPGHLPDWLDWYQADGQGRVRLAMHHTGFDIVASRAGEWAAVRVPDLPLRGQGPVVLTLARPRGFDVVVADSLGTPSPGMHVELHYRQVGQKFGPRKELRQDERGIARVALAEPLLTRLNQEQRLRVAVEAMHGVSSEVFDVASVLGGELRLEVPAAGEVQLRFVDADGQLLEGVAVRAQFEAVGSSRGSSVIESTTGLCSFRGLLSQADFSVLVSSDGFCNERRKGVAPGPGGVLEIEVPLKVGREITYSGRLLDESGTPLGNRGFTFDGSIKVAGQSGSAWLGFDEPLVTDGDGRFGASLWNPVAGELLEHRLYLLPVFVTETGQVLSAEVDRDYSEATVEHFDLGDVVMTGYPLFVGGIVVDQGGRPLAGVEMRVLHELEGEGGPQQVGALRFPLLTEVLRQSHGTAVSGSDGRFQIRLNPELLRANEPMVVDARLQGYALEGVQKWTEPGSDDVVVRLQSAGSLEASLLERGLSRTDHFFAQLVPSGVTLNVPIRRLGDLRSFVDNYVCQRFDAQTTVPIRPDRAFGWQAVPPGSYSLLIVSHAHGLTARIDGIEIEAGMTCSDPRLFGIDPYPDRGLLELEVSDAHGQPIENGGVWEMGPNGAWQLLARVNMGHAVLRPREVSIHVLVTAQGQLDLELRGLTASRSVQLEAGFPVRLALDQSVDPAMGSYEGEGYLVGLDVVCRCEEDAFGWPNRRSLKGLRMTLDADGAATAYLPRLGTYTFAVEGIDDPNDWRGTEMFRVEFEIGEGDRGHLFVLKPAAED